MDSKRARKIGNHVSAVLPDNWHTSAQLAERIARSDFTADGFWYVAAYNQGERVMLVQDGLTVWAVTAAFQGVLAGDLYPSFDSYEAALAYYHMTGELSELRL